MANHKSALKKTVQDRKRRARNRFHRSRLRTQVKKFRAAVAAGDTDGAQQLLGPTLALVDRSAKHGVLHANAADRTKSRLSRAFARMGA
jgi:small subunit ribosomal protein S20